MFRTISLSALCILCIVTLCSAVEFTDCGSKVGKFTQVTVSNCDMSKPACDFVRNTNSTITIEFTPSKEITSVLAVVHGIIMDVEIPFPISNAAVCKDSNSGVTCPLKKDAPYTYQTTLPIEKSYPKVTVTVKWELQDENHEDIVCVLVPAKIR